MANVKKVVKIADLLQPSAQVEVAPDQLLEFRPLNLKEMVVLFLESSEMFLSLFAAGMEEVTVEKLSTFLLSAPELVAKILAFASDDPENWPLYQVKLPPTVQLIALAEVWKMSVPDAKKAADLLSEVTGQLSKLQKDGKLPSAPPPTTGQTTLPSPSNA